MEARPLEVLQQFTSGPMAADPLGASPLAARDLIDDHDVLLFSFLRSTMGLPVDDARWWPTRPARQPGWFATPAGAPVTGAEKSGTAAWRIDGAVVVSGRFAPPTVALLERTLAALRG